MAEAKTEQIKIVAWMKPSCGWSNGVRAIFRKYGLEYEDRDMINNPANFQEMVTRTGQRNQPCVEVNGTMLADVSGEEVEAWLIEHGYVEASTEDAGVPIDRSCEGEHAAQPVAIQFQPRG